MKDQMWCGSLAAHGASCFHTLTTDQQMMTLKEFAEWWDDLKDPKVATSASNLAEIKGDVEKFCSLNPCTYDMTAQVNQLSAKLDKVITQSKKTK